MVPRNRLPDAGKPLIAWRISLRNHPQRPVAKYSAGGGRPISFQDSFMDDWTPGQAAHYMEGVKPELPDA
jgi:hypothetical protein